MRFGAYIYIYIIYILTRQQRLRAPGIAEYPPSLRAVVISAMFKINKDTIVIILEPEEGEEAQSWSSRKGSSLNSTTRATESTAVRFTKVGVNTTSVEMVTQLSLGEHVSSAATKAITKKHLAQATEAAYFFNNTLGGAEMTEDDGKLAAEELMIRVKQREKGRRKGEVVTEFITTNKAFGEMVEKYSFMGPLLCAVVENKLHPTVKVKNGKA